MENKMTREEAEINVYRQSQAGGRVACPICDKATNGRVLRGNFSGSRDTRIPVLIRHIRRDHFAGEAK